VHPGRVAPCAACVGRHGREAIVTFCIGSITISKALAVALGPGLPLPPLSQSVPVASRTSANSCPDGWREHRPPSSTRVEQRGWVVRDVHIRTQPPHKQREQQESNHSSHNSDTRRRAREAIAKKEAGAAGGESGARAHGPALGGEAGSVLIVSLSAKCPRMPPPVVVSLPPVVNPLQVPVAASARMNYNICGRI
jgi:hypothetical protein